MKSTVTKVMGQVIVSQLIIVVFLWVLSLFYPLKGQDAAPTPVPFGGTIVQVIPEGVLVRGFPMGSLPGRVAFLKNYGSNSAEGDIVNLKAYRDGVFTYTGTDGAQHQIAAYTPAAAE